MPCKFCAKSVHIYDWRWRLSEGGWGCQRCITRCENEKNSCYNLAFKRLKGKSNCRDCWGNNAVSEGLFCPDCKGFLSGKKCYNRKNCNIGGEGKTLRGELTFGEDGDILPKLTDKTFELVLENDNEDDLTIYVKSLDGYFEWPTTETHPKLFGTSILLSTEGWPAESPLKIMGYNVSQMDNLSASDRQRILGFCFSSPRLPWVKNLGYMKEWGQASSASRLKKMAHLLASMGRKMRNRTNTLALGKYNQDLAYLKSNYYDDKFGFGWPSTEDY